MGGGGVSHLHFACSLRGKHSEKGQGASHPIVLAVVPLTALVVGVPADLLRDGQPKIKDPRLSKCSLSLLSE